MIHGVYGNTFCICFIDFALPTRFFFESRYRTVPCVLSKTCSLTVLNIKQKIRFSHKRRSQNNKSLGLSKVRSRRTLFIFSKSSDSLKLSPMYSRVLGLFNLSPKILVLKRQTFTNTYFVFKLVYFIHLILRCIKSTN